MSQEVRFKNRAASFRELHPKEDGIKKAKSREEASQLSDSVGSKAYCLIVRSVVRIFLENLSEYIYTENTPPIISRKLGRSQSAGRSSCYRETHLFGR